MQLFDDMDIKNEPRGFLLVDVRRDDWVVSFGDFLLGEVSGKGSDGGGG